MAAERTRPQGAQVDDEGARVGARRRAGCHPRRHAQPIGGTSVRRSDRRYRETQQPPALHERVGGRPARAILDPVPQVADPHVADRIGLQPGRERLDVFGSREVQGDPGVGAAQQPAAAAG